MADTTVVVAQKLSILNHRIEKQFIDTTNKALVEVILMIWEHLF